MPVTLIIAWMMVTPGQPDAGHIESIRIPLPHMEACSVVAGSVAAFIEKAPTKEGVKFALRCEPGAQAAPPEPEDDRGI